MNPDRTPLSTTDWIAFGPFVLRLKPRALTQSGKPVTLNPRALELLVALLERPGVVLSKDELADRIWRDRTVDEVNLRVAVAALRRCLAAASTGETYILNSVGRGYAFSRDVSLEFWPRRSDELVVTEPLPALGLQGQLPRLLKPVIGRENVEGRIANHLARSRLVTVVGPPGIGKTTVAISTASKLSSTVGDTRFVDFAPGRDPRLVLARIAASLTLEIVGGDPLRMIIDATDERPTLIVLDNCEPVIGAVAEAADAILQNAPRVKILATSREPLRAAGEVVYRLEGLAYPEKGFKGGAAEALAYPAVELLVERVRAASTEFVLDDSLASHAAEVCRRLDGIALAIQLAAGRIASIGLIEVASRLDDRFRLLSRGARTALPRHQTLDAAINWSFELLDTQERLVCVRLSIFSGEFSLDAAIDLAEWAPIQALEAASLIASLVEKSLIVFIADPVRPR